MKRGQVNTCVIRNILEGATLQEEGDSRGTDCVLRKPSSGQHPPHLSCWLLEHRKNWPDSGMGSPGQQLRGQGLITQY